MEEIKVSSEVTSSSIAHQNSVLCTLLRLVIVAAGLALITLL